VDEKPFGGGAGMVLKPEPIFKCVESLPPANRRAGASGGKKGWAILLTPRGRPLTQEAAARLARKRHLILICGHYEGVDERVSRHLADEEISLGDFVTMGGEAPALCLIEAVLRLLPGVLGNPESLKEESFSHSRNGLSVKRLEFPQYTRPREFRSWKVPAVLLSGNHEAIREWRRKKSLAVTRGTRPDLLTRPRQKKAGRKG
jgi:tRNA (guanine37-N1)-methyltransferase